MTGTIFEENYRAVMRDAESRSNSRRLEPQGNTWFEVHSYPSGGGISVFFRDITERKRMEDERLTTSKLESLGTLAGGIAHDMNNVLTVISGNIGLAQLEAPTHCGNLLSFLAKAGQAAQHAARLSSQLLTFSKGGAPLKKVASVARSPDSARRNFPSTARTCAPTIEIEDHLGKAEIDAGQIEQVINALMHQRAGSDAERRQRSPSARRTIQVTEKSVCRWRPGATSRSRSPTHGPGVPPDLATKIFDPYFTTKPTSSGLGSGDQLFDHQETRRLSPSRKQLPGRRHFRLLPADGARARWCSDPLQPNETRPTVSQQRILVMDDEAAIRELTSQLLATMGYEVTAVPDGSEAVRIYERARAKAKHFKAVILDATVRGGLGGVETIARLRRSDPEVNAIICSGYSDDAALSRISLLRLSRRTFRSHSPGASWPTRCEKRSRTIS